MADAEKRSICMLWCFSRAACPANFMELKRRRRDRQQPRVLVNVLDRQERGRRDRQQPRVLLNVLERQERGPFNGCVLQTDDGFFEWNYCQQRLHAPSHPADVGLVAEREDKCRFS